ncbi:MAG: FIST C-terminal domain-containing protein [Pseudomonadales bacterium]|nr:FIST C-terminal domain-containing protein [Pseudomonadales bacterium]
MTDAISIRKGTSRLRDPELAAAELFAALDQPDIQLVVFYCAADFDLPALAKALHSRFHTINIVGCTTAGEITPQGYLAGALTGFSLAAPTVDVAMQAIPLDPFDSVSTGTTVTALIKQLGSRNGLPPGATDTFAFLLIDGLAMQEELVVSCIHQQLQGIDMIGGSAADDTRFAATYVYHNGQFRQNIAVLTLVRSDLPFVAFRTQHFTRSNKRMVVTRADPAKRLVFEINGRPAGREFARLVDLNLTELTPQIFATHPVVVRVGGQYFVRSIGMVNPDESLTFFCAIDEGIVLTIAKGVDMVENLEQAFDEVRAKLGEPLLVLGCDCVLRRLETEREDIKDRIGAIFAANNVVGFATYGEQFNSMHVNQTFTGIAIGRRASDAGN